ncbi:MAG: Na+/H+ antiporter NhaA [Hyphomonadaceae bacterium]
MASKKPHPFWWERDTTPGYLLLAAAVLSFVLSNSALTPAWKTLLAAPFELTIGGYALTSTIKAMVKDALMAVFFLYVGLELKRECVEGPFRNPREAALPALGAIGGMAAPALIFLFIAGDAYARGWAIPTATDIAFAVGVLSLLGARVPAGLRLFLLALAIADDLGAILVIALFYSGPLNTSALAVSALLTLALFVLNWRGVRALTPYWVLGVLLWGAMAQTGMSPTLAGVLTALAIPMHRPDGHSPLVAAEHALKVPVQLGIMPIFALASAGVSLAGVTPADVMHPVALGIAAGLVLGKPIGIFTLTWIGSKLLRQTLPASPLALVGAAMIAGIGFTMSLFVGALAFPEDAMQAPVRFGVLGGSLISACLGLALLSLALPSNRSAARSEALAEQEATAESEGVFEKRD